MDFSRYDDSGAYDEMFSQADGAVGARPAARILAQRLESMNEDDLLRRQNAAERMLLNLGITFNVYGHSAGREKIFPFDIIPRIVSAAEWSKIERGLVQRVRALNEFIHDVYHEQKILKDKVVPEELLASATSYLPACRELTAPHKIYCHVTGVDLIRDVNGEFMVLEDNLRCPSGVSYVLANRAVMKRTFPNAFAESNVVPVDAYPSRLREMLEFVAPKTRDKPTAVLLTPGSYNSAYFEHSFLAQQMGIELVLGRDLVVRDGFVHMRTTRGYQRVDVIYRRIDDTFLDPQTFRADSLLGVPGLIDVYKRGRVSLANAPGTGIADDKGIYPFVPKMIRYYLDEDAILPNVPTFNCSDDTERAHVLENLDKLVVKAANESGGYGMLIGPQASAAEREEFARRIQASPRNYIAQPLISLSRVPTLIPRLDGGRETFTIEGRHVDLRPYVLYGEDIYVLPGGLTRVALRKGSYVVNSSQGGGSKDTWVERC